MSSKTLESIEPLRRILLVRLSAIGDCVHALPVIEALRRQLPGVEIGWAVQRSGRAVVDSLDAADRYHLFPREARGLQRASSLLRFSRELRAQRYQVAIDLQGNSKSGLVAALSGARRRIGLARRERRELNRLFVPLPPETTIPGSTGTRDVQSASLLHVIERNLMVLAQLGLRLELPAPALDLRPADSDVAQPREVVLCPSTTWPTKIWPATSFVELAARLARSGKRVEVFWGTAAERAEAEQIVASARGVVDADAVDRLVLAPELALEELAGYLAAARLVVGNDSGPVHLAAALGTPSVGVFGATDPHRNGLYWPHTRSIWRDDADLVCRPCWSRSCARGDLACLERISVDAVLSACRELYSPLAEAR